MNPITHINFKINHSAALLEMDHFLTLAENYKDSRCEVEGWKVIRNVYLPYASKVAAALGFSEASPRYYILHPNTDIPMHTDVNTKCSINFIISDASPAPIKYESGLYTYTSALIDTTLLHGVPNNTKYRKLLKLSLMETSYEEACDRLHKDGFAV